MALEELVTEYLRLALRLNRLAPGSVDTQPGDVALKHLVEDGPATTPAELARTADRLVAALAEAGDGPRGRFLAAQARAIGCTARRLDGAPLPFAVEVAECFGTPATWGDEDRYAAAHRELDALLPGRGPLTARIAAHRRADEVPPHRLGTAVRALSEALRARVHPLVGLPADESVEYRVVDDAPWSALSRYLGGGRSLVQINAAARLRAAQLPQLVAHESYPGHHTDTCRKHLRLVRDAGQREHALLVVSSPQSLLAEGVADVGLPVLVGPGWGRWAQEVLAGVGVRTDGELAERVDAAMAGLLRVRLDAALLLHERGATDDDAAAHLRRWLLVDEARARQMLRFLTSPRWRAYTATYVEGFLLVREWLHRPGRDADPVARFRELLDEAWTPAALRADLDAAGRPHAERPYGGQPDVYFR